MQTICMPADRPTTMLFSPIRGTMCNTRMHIVYVWKETKIPQVQARKKKKTNSTNKTSTKQANTPQIRYWFREMPAFSGRYCVPQVSATVSRCRSRSKSSTLCPRLVCRDCWHRSFHFHQPSAVPTGDFSTCPRNVRWFWFSACAGRAPRAEAASHISLCWVMHEEGGQEVLCCDSYCALETWAGRVIPLPVYLSTSSFPVTVQGTRMFRKMYLWKKNPNK